MKRTKICDRVLPVYSAGEETMNMVTHIVGGGLGLLMGLACILRSRGSLDCVIYAAALVALYTMSSVYHGLRPGTGKKVMQVLDHCTIYLLIAGTYTPIVVSGLGPVYPGIAGGLLLLEWGLTVLAVSLTAIDLRKYRVFSMICYIGMGWAIIPMAPQVIQVVGPVGFGFLLAGGISYTVGAVLYGLGKRKKWMHSVFHILVVLGSALQFVSIYQFVL